MIRGSRTVVDDAFRVNAPELAALLGAFFDPRFSIMEDRVIVEISALVATTSELSRTGSTLPSFRIQLVFAVAKNPRSRNLG